MKPNTQNAKPRLVLFEWHHLGDAILSLPFLRGATECYRVVVFCTPQVAELYRLCLPGIETVSWRPFWVKGGGKGNRSEGSVSFFGLIRKLRAFKADAAVSVWPDPRAHFFMALSGAKVRIGFALTNDNIYASGLPWRRREIFYGRLAARLLEAVSGGRWLTLGLEKKSSSQAHWEDWRQMSGALGAAWRDALPWFDPAAEDLRGEMADFFQKAALSGKPVFLLHAGAGHPTKRWPVERFQAVIHEWFTRGKIPLVIVDDGSGMIPVPEGPDQITCRPANLALFLKILGRVDAVLCNDSLPSHAAAALGKKVFTIFGSASTAWFAPYKNEAHVVSSDVCPFRPCLGRCVQPSFICLEAVQPRDVIEKLKSGI
ncbi:MAG: glycosyltransferase family 9 protein [Methylacidiphilales bacterium]|nr:glycosyltransferase family 9 protein [Candidatus Methylacidiphilales bacterium]